jgi:type I restriction enzyme, S subunit
MSAELRKHWEHAGGQLPDDWTIVPLETLLRDSKSIAVGVMYPGPDTPGGTPLLKVGDIKDGAAVRPSYCISAATDEEHRRTKLIGDELLMTLVGNPGECVVVTPEMAGWNPARAIAVIRLQDISLRTYLKTVFESTAGRHLIDAVLNTTVQKTLNLKDIRKLPIPLPTDAEIKWISGISEALTDRITLLRETNATLEGIAQALFKSWFVDFDPVRAKMQGSAPEGMDEATAALFPDSLEESTLGLVPRGWHLMPFGQLLSHTIGGDWGSDIPDETKDARVAIIRGTDIPDLQSGANSRVPVRYTSHKKLSTRKLEDGDIVLEVSGGSKDQPTGRALYLTAGLLGQFDCPVEPASFCRLLRPNSKDIGVLLGQHLTYIYAQGKTWEYQNQSTGISNFQTTHFLEKELVVVPSEDVLATFAETIRPMVDRSHLTQIQTLATLRDTLLPRLISGQLRLPQVWEEAA